MKEYEILEHTAELKIRAFGKTRKELFLDMMRGMMAALRAEIRNPKSKIRNIKIKSPDINALLVDFLNECLYLSEVNREIYDHVKFEKFTDSSIGSGQAELAGELTGKKIERFGEDIKAVTYHGVDVKKNKEELWQVEVIFDI